MSIRNEAMIVTLRKLDSILRPGTWRCDRSIERGPIGSNRPDRCCWNIYTDQPQGRPAHIAEIMTGTSGDHLAALRNLVPELVRHLERVQQALEAIAND